MSYDGHGMVSYSAQGISGDTGCKVTANELLDYGFDQLWTVVRGSDLEEGESQGLPVWSKHVGDPILASNRTRRIDFALFMVDALTNDELVHEAPAIVGRQTPSALAHAAID